MIDVYVWNTPNGRKPLILLEELGLPYKLHAVDIGNGEQFAPDFLKFSPNGKIPALIDGRGDETISVFESGAILQYLAEAEGKFLPTKGQERVDALAWLFFQMASVGPMFGQLGHFQRAEGEHPYSIKRYQDEVLRLYGVMDKRLSDVPYLAGEYSIADMATYPWADAFGYFNLDPKDWPNVQAWLKRVGERPAVKKATAIEIA